jgi:hypothetical protein
MTRKAFTLAILALAASAAFGGLAPADASAHLAPRFRVLAFYTGKDDAAHVSFVHEAKTWFARMADEHGFAFEATADWDNLNPTFLAPYQVVVFLDTRPEAPAQRAAFETYMKHGGAWIGFHFAGFALTPSKYPQDWDWYHNEFLGSGAYVSNTWKPTSAILRVEAPTHPAMASLPPTFKSAPNEWYRWAGKLRDNPDIQVLASIDPASFPLGTGPKPHEIWHDGDYPVVWTNRKYRMLYLNMGHNDMDNSAHPPKTVSSSFSSPEQNRLILNALEWLGTPASK